VPGDGEKLLGTVLNYGLVAPAALTLGAWHLAEAAAGTACADRIRQIEKQALGRMRASPESSMAPNNALTRL
jgi:hypothetical protein